MPGPFPGMDPFLENHWGDVHTSLTTYARNQLQPQLPRELQSRAGEGVTIEVDDEPAEWRKPDVRIIEPTPAADFGGGTAVAEAVAVAESEAAEPVLVPIEAERPTPRRVVVVDRDGGRVVTAIKFLSPHNKLTERARSAFRRKQNLLLAGGVNLVEIDLLRQGGWTLSVREPAPRQSWSEPYRACAIRAERPSQAECYVVPLRERLPKLRIPLRPDDPDATLDLQPLIDAAWRLRPHRLRPRTAAAVRSGRSRVDPRAADGGSVAAATRSVPSPSGEGSGVRGVLTAASPFASVPRFCRSGGTPGRICRRRLAQSRKGAKTTTRSHADTRSTQRFPLARASALRTVLSLRSPRLCVRLILPSGLCAFASLRET